MYETPLSRAMGLEDAHAADGQFVGQTVAAGVEFFRHPVDNTFGYIHNSLERADQLEAQGNDFAAAAERSSLFFNAGMAATGGYGLARTALPAAGRVAGSILTEIEGTALQSGSLRAQIGSVGSDVSTVRPFEAGDTVVANNVVDLTPRVDLTSAFKVKPYRNGSFDLDYRYPDRHGLAATIGTDKTIGIDGILGFEIKAGGDVAKLGSGKDMFYSMMQRANAEGITVNGVRGYWIDGTNSTNYAMYRAAVSEDMTAEQAALRTWTGQRSVEYGFTNVVRVEDTGRSIKAWFVRPPGG
jgi:hypothetical protein